VTDLLVGMGAGLSVGLAWGFWLAVYFGYRKR
jgi:hypothetical protein